MITNETGLNVNTTFANLKPFLPKAASQNAVNDRLHRNEELVAVAINKQNSNEFKVAFPNDRAKSVAPFNRNEKYKFNIRTTTTKTSYFLSIIR